MTGVAPERCITCSDEAVEAVVVELDGLEAVVLVGEGRGRVAVDLVPDVAPGDRLLCHAGIALERLERTLQTAQVAQSHKLVPAADGMGTTG